jgi:hypothetical protein
MEYTTQKQQKTIYKTEAWTKRKSKLAITQVSSIMAVEEMNPIARFCTLNPHVY